MRFLVDAQLPPALARALTSAGHSAEHVAEIGLAAAPDETIWLHALKIGAAIISKDEDFSRLCIVSEGPAVIWRRCPNTRRQHLIAWFEPLLPDILSALASGERLIEVVWRGV